MGPLWSVAEFPKSVDAELKRDYTSHKWFPGHRVGLFSLTLMMVMITMMMEIWEKFLFKSWSSHHIHIASDTWCMMRRLLRYLHGRLREPLLGELYFEEPVFEELVFEELLFRESWCSERTVVQRELLFRENCFLSFFCRTVVWRGFNGRTAVDGSVVVRIVFRRERGCWVWDYC